MVAGSKESVKPTTSILLQLPKEDDKKSFLFTLKFGGGEDGGVCGVRNLWNHSVQ